MYAESFMNLLITSIILIVAGILGAAGVIIKKKPEAAELISKITPWQGWIGVVLIIWGIWDVIQVLGMLGWISFVPVFVIAKIVIAIIELGLGILLGWSLIVKYTGGGGEKGQEMYSKLVPFQAIFGFAAIIAAIFWLLVGFGIFNFLILASVGIPAV